MKRIYDPRKVETDFFNESVVVENVNELISLYDKFDVKSPVVGTLQNVVYIGQDEQHFLFDGNFKDVVRVENKQVEAKYLKNTNIGDHVDVYISEVNNDQFFIRGSVSEIYENRAHQTLNSLLKSVEEGDVFSCLVKEHTPAGYNLDIYLEGVTIAGFMPNTEAHVNKLVDVNSIVGQTISAVLETYSREKGTYVVSRKKYQETLIPEAVKKLKTDTVYEGHVTGIIPDKCVFVEFNEFLTGMIHKSNILENYQEQMNNFHLGLEIQFYVKDFEKTAKKTKINLTQIQKESIFDKLKYGQKLTVKVKKVNTGGIVVSVDEETDGLIHSSEVAKSEKTYCEGDELIVKVLKYTKIDKKIYLSIYE